MMNNNSLYGRKLEADTSPILLVPYMWIGDFVRCHTVVRLLNQRFPGAPVDMLATTTVAPLVDYMPGVRKAVVVDLPRKQLPLQQYRALAGRLRAERYGQALIMPRTWKSALAPFMAGIPLRTGFAGEARFGLLNDLRWGERRLPRMVDRCAALALPKDAAPQRKDAASLPAWPPPQLVVPQSEISAWRQAQGLPPGRQPVVALAPGAVGPSKRWHAYSELAARLTADGAEVWVLGGPGEKSLAAEICGPGQTNARDLTGPDLRKAILALAAADVAVSNDSGLLHVAAAIGTPAVGIFGPTSPWHWAPLNPIAAALETDAVLPCRPCHKPTCRMGHHLCMREISVERVLGATRAAAASARPS